MSKVWIVRFGACAFRYYTDYHAEQFCNALRRNGTPFTLSVETR